MTTTLTDNLSKQVIQLQLDAWTAQNKRVTDFFSAQSDEVYLNEVAPGRNRAIYLLGHLISSSDGMLPLLGLGERLYPQLEAVFSLAPDKTITDIPSLDALRGYWKNVNEKLTAAFNALTPEEWLAKHTAVSDADFALAPNRNRLNVLISRTLHEGYHFGQLNFLTRK